MRALILTAVLCGIGAGADAQLRISEVMANPNDAQGGERAGEFVELFNLGTEPVDLDGWSVADDISQDRIFPFESGGPTLLQPRAYGLILDPDYDGQYGELPPDLLLTRPENAAIGNGLSAVDSVRLIDPDGNIHDEFIPPASAEDGVSYERIDLNQPGGPTNWRPSSDPSGSSIGRASTDPPPPVEPTDPTALKGVVVINEILFNPQTDAPEWIEMRSLAKEPIAVEAWFIEDERQKPAPISNAVIPAEGYLILTRSADDFKTAHPDAPKEIVIAETPLPALNNDGDLVRITVNGETIDETTYGKWNGQRGQSLERRDAEAPSNREDNWTLSVHPTGSTPGLPNTAQFDAPDQPTLQALPNPFDPRENPVELRYEAPLAAMITLRIFNSAGLPMRELLLDAPRGGKQTVPWDGRDNAGRIAPPGIYIALLIAIEGGKHSSTAIALVLAER